MKWKKKIYMFIVSFIIIFIAYSFTAHFSVEKPIIESISRPFIENETIDNGIVLELYGQNLSDIICIYLNNMWEKECIVQYVSEEEIYLTLPQQYSEDVATLTIQLEKKINSDKTVFSNKAHIQDIEDGSLIRPVITSTIPEVLELSNTGNKTLKIAGRNFNESCIVSVNDKEYDVNYIDESNLEVTFPYSDWCDNEFMTVKILYSSINGDRIDSLTSNDWVVKVIGNRENELSYDWIQNRYVAHAFGAYSEKTYTNSLEAFMENYAKGFRVFEVDMTFASDNTLILRHDWWSGTLRSDTDFTNSKINNLPKSFDEIRNATQEYTVLSFDDLCEIMLEYPDIFVVTDTKDTNSSAINEIFCYIVDHAKIYDESILNRIIVQIYNEQMYYQVMNVYAFKSIIYTLYQTTSSDEEVLHFVENTGIKVVGMFETRMSESFVKKLNALGVYVYIYTINDRDTVNRLLQIGVYGFYTDFLSVEELNFEEKQSTRDLKLIDSIEDYINSINLHSELMMIISVKDDASVGMEAQLQRLLYSCGAEETLLDSYRSGYVLITKAGKTIYEEKSSKNIIEYINVFGESSCTVVSGGYECGNVSKIIIDNIDYSPNQRGLNIVLYDVKNKVVYDVINYDLYGGRIFTRYDIVEMKNRQLIKENLDFMLEYFDALVNQNYLILFSVNDDAGSYFTEEIEERWKRFGLNKIEYRKSYIGIIDSLECIYEDSSDANLIYDEFVNNIHVYVTSAGFEAGSFSSINIDGVEYSKNTRGLNIVVFDKRRNIVIDRITFDMFDKYCRNY